MLIDNTLLLREKYPAIRKYFLDYKDDIKLDALEVLESKSGAETIRYQTDDKHLMVHSMYDPVREAERIITSHKEKINSDTHVFFYGIGMGYHIDKFQEWYPNNTYSVYEPNPDIFLAMTQQKQLNQIITKNTKHFYIDTHETESNSYLKEFSSSNKNTQIIILPSYENIVKEKVTLFHQKVKDVIRNRRTNLQTDSKFQKLWVKNSLLNFNEILNTPNMMTDVDQTHFAGKPVMIISAGPSLAEDMEHIRYIKENSLAYIFAVGSSINSLIEYDVLPDVVCTYDPSKMNQEVYRRMIDNNINHIPMMFGSSVGYETLTKYKGPKVHFVTTQDKTSTYFLDQQIDLKHDLIADSPSIAVMTFQVLNKLGASPIIFAGQNLGYLNDQLYSKGIEYDHVNSSVNKKQLENAITIEDVFGNKIKTNKGFNRMRVGIERLANIYSDKIFINTTKNGAAIDGVPFQPIEDVLKNMLIKPIEKKIWWNENNSYDRSKLKYKEEQLKQSMVKFKDLIVQFEKLLDSISTYTKLKNKLMLESLLVQFDKLYEQLNQNIYYANFISFYIRVHVQFMTNEIKQTNQERDIIIKSEKLVLLFTKFIEQCKEGKYKVDQIINTKMK
ncbi:motility associated factor glycosyltransferase family protein [Virgibacillus byunsanensis]|uniref:Motility associated factor glycosyltransferase family protein n=1 Tax=Virgibacillus byunsanensis TaxID=570945 RepID=A0ABW3LG40_9BACI